MRLWALIPLLFAVPANAQSSLAEQGNECAKVSDSLARLTCFDELFQVPADLVPIHSSPAFNQDGYYLDLFNTGGLSTTIAVGYDRETTVSVYARQHVTNVSYLIRQILKDGYHDQIAYGTIDTLLPDNMRNLATTNLELNDRSSFVACLDFTRTDTGNKHILVSFLEEQPSSASGKATYASASEFTAPISLVTNGAFTCDNAITPWFIDGLPHRERFSASARPEVDEHSIDGRARPSTLQLMTDTILTEELHFEFDLYAHSHLADVSFWIVAEPISGGNDTIRIASNVPYMTVGSTYEIMEAMGPDVLDGLVPWSEVRFNTCATYFVVEEQRYLKETWSRDYSIAEMRASPNPDGGWPIYPSEINWTDSGSPMAC